MARKVQKLGNQLEKVMNKYNEEVELKKTYEVLETRLSEERLGHEK